VPFGCATWTSCVLTVCFLLAFGEMCRSTAIQRRAFGCNPLDEVAPQALFLQRLSSVTAVSSLISVCSANYWTS